MSSLYGDVTRVGSAGASVFDLVRRQREATTRPSCGPVLWVDHGRQSAPQSFGTHLVL